VWFVASVAHDGRRASARSGLVRWREPSRRATLLIRDIIAPVRRQLRIIHTRRLQRGLISPNDRPNGIGRTRPDFPFIPQGYPQHTHRTVNRTASQQPAVECDGTSTTMTVEGFLLPWAQLVFWGWAGQNAGTIPAERHADPRHHRADASRRLRRQGREGGAADWHRGRQQPAGAADRAARGVTDWRSSRAAWRGSE
jgi:hypothetical protein